MIRTPVFLRVLPSAAAVVAAFCIPLQAAPPAVYAIRSARIVPVSGPTLERGTVVVRDGLIEAVGAEVSIPGDARVIDGKGLTVYPGLIDALSDGSSATAAPQPVPMGTTVPVTVPEEGGNLRSFFRVADTVTDGGQAATTARQAGVTAVLSAPNRGIFAGQSAVLSFNGDRGTTVVRSPVAMHVRFTAGGFRNYPGSLMGLLAYVKQTLLDAERYRDAWAIYNRSPRGLQRPDTDRALEALVPVVDGRLPLVLPGSSAPEIQRALKLGEGSKVRIWLSGGGESRDVSADLKRRNVPVLLSLRFPERPNLGPDSEESLRSLKRRVEAPKCALELEKAGVRFAFSSGGASAQDFVRNAGRAVKAGLSAESALRALTLSSAELLGVDQQLGSIEAGKVASLVVTDGDLFAERTRVRHVFVDGKHYPADAPAAPTTPTPAAEAEEDH
jgi:imidazolonepropionase-like amidohydrolase